ncbi:MAG: beta-propeller fold lactonase family protein [Capsulimonadaceae bacterium]|nr:beta-propeller fold lactonase family protein [Capsulimonadaceae bacterium]
MKRPRILLLLLGLAVVIAASAYAWRLYEQSSSSPDKFEAGSYSASIGPNLPDGKVNFAAAAFRYLYVIGYGIAGYRVNSDGILVSMKVAESGNIGCRTDAVAVGRSGEWMYLGCTPVWRGHEGGATVLPCRIQPAGTIKPALSLRVPLPGKPVSMTTDQSGKALYVGTDRGIFQYALGPDGKAHPMTPGLAPGKDGAADVVISPNGRYAYATNFSKRRIYQYRVEADGRLTAQDPLYIETGPGPMETRIDPHGHFVWCLTSMAESVDRFEIGPDGRLRRLSPAVDSLGRQPTSLAVTPDGQHAYIARYRYNSVLQFRIQPNGSFTPSNPISAPGSGSPSVVRLDPAGRYAFALNWQHAIMSLYSVNAGGTLDPAKPSNILCPGWPREMVFVDKATAVPVAH